jgi:hypothetical protein
MYDLGGINRGGAKDGEAKAWDDLEEDGGQGGEEKGEAEGKSKQEKGKPEQKKKQGGGKNPVKGRQKVREEEEDEEVVERRYDILELLPS